MKIVIKTMAMITFALSLAAANVLVRRLTEFWYPIDVSWIVGSLVIVRWMSNKIDSESI